MNFMLKLHNFVVSISRLAPLSLPDITLCTICFFNGKIRFITTLETLAVILQGANNEKKFIENLIIQKSVHNMNCNEKKVALR